MATPIIPSEPSTVTSSKDPNSITNIAKFTDEIKKQAKSDEKYDTKGNMYQGFQDGPTQQSVLSIGLSFAIAAGILLVVGAFLPKTKKRY